MDDEQIRRDVAAQMLGGHVNMDRVILSEDGFGLEIYTPDAPGFEPLAVVILKLPGGQLGVGITPFHGLLEATLDVARNLDWVDVIDPRNN